MTAQSAVLAGRRAAEAQMVDTVTITMGGTTVYSGKCRLQSYEAFEGSPEAGAHTYTVQRYRLFIPVGVAQVPVNALATITASALDPSSTPREFVVAALLHKTHATAQRLMVEEVPA